MIFFYIRHGDPIYKPDSLTPLGERQAEAVGKRLALYGLDEIYSSTSERAILTAKPACELLRKEPILLDFANEKYVHRELSVVRNEKRGWLFTDFEMSRLFHSPELRALGDRWYEHPALAEYDYKKGMERVYDGADQLLASLGYEHDRYTGSYRVVAPNDKRVALFAHEGFGHAFLSCLLDIPYPQFCTHFHLGHSSVTVIEFREWEDGFCIPRVCTLANDGHLYREGLPTKYLGRFSF